MAPTGPAGRRPAGGPPPRPAAPARPSDLGAELAGRFATLFCEVEAGVRPRRHLVDLLSPSLYARLVHGSSHGGDVGRVVRVRAASVTPQVLEAVAVVRRGDRLGALAMRLVRQRGGWRVEEVATPESPPLPPSTVPPGDDDLAIA